MDTIFDDIIALGTKKTWVRKELDRIFTAFGKQLATRAMQAGIKLDIDTVYELESFSRDACWGSAKRIYNIRLYAGPDLAELTLERINMDEHGRVTRVDLCVLDDNTDFWIVRLAAQSLSNALYAFNSFIAAELQELNDIKLDSCG
jgi:hypothetical protein